MKRRLITEEEELWILDHPHASCKEVQAYLHCGHAYADRIRCELGLLRKVPEGLTRLSDEQQEWFYNNFSEQKDSDVAKSLGVSITTVRRWGWMTGLQKSENFKQRMSQERAERVLLCGFKKGGRTPLDFSKEVKERSRAKKSESMFALYRKERCRVAFGLPQKTKLKITRKDPCQSAYMKRLLKKGYVLDSENRIAYFSEETERNPRMERRNPKLFTFLPATVTACADAEDDELTTINQQEQDV